MADGIIAEGFICPLCFKEFSAIHDLEHHYIETHSKAERDGLGLGRVKGIFGKAKEKLWKLQNLNNSTDLGVGGNLHHDLEDTSLGDEGAYSYTTEGLDHQWDAQEIGAINDLSMDFKVIRDSRIEFYAIEFNKLVIRLEKLLAIDTFGTLEFKRRKAQEKVLIPWVKNEDVPLCPTCGKQFNLPRRRHHCRLCGAIMCNKCSEFIAASFAKDFIKDVKASSEISRPVISNPGASSSSSVTDEEPTVRSCFECYKVLIQKAQQIQDSNTKSVIEQLYKKLKGFMDEVEQDCPLYIEMCQSLRLGKEDYELEKVNQLRVKLMQLYEIIDTVSKKVANLGLNADPPPSNTELRLQKAVRQGASVFLQNNLFALNTPPSEEEYNKLRRERQLEIERQIALERQLVSERHRQYEERRLSLQTETPHVPRQRSPTATVVANSGWLPQSHDRGSTSDNLSNAIKEQIEKVKSYIRQANDSQRFDEVNMLEDNLKDLITEYSLQREREDSDL